MKRSATLSYSKSLGAIGAGLLVAASFWLASVGHANAEENIENSIKQSVDSVEPLPVSGMILAQKGNKVKIVSTNGRFEVRGELYDRWAGHAIDTPDKARRSYNYLDFNGINFSADLLTPHNYGHGEKKITVFVDPLCPYCKKVINEMAGLEDEYTFQIIPIGILGKRSQELVMQMACEDHDKGTKALMTEDYSSLQPVASSKDGCQEGMVGKRAVSAQLLGIKGVPYMIRHDGLVGRGYPKLGLSAWLEG